MTGDAAGAPADGAGEPEIGEALASIGSSTVIVLGGTVLGQGLGLVARMVMTRYLPVSGYGNVAIGITVLNVLAIFALVGLEDALPRFLPRAEDRRDEGRILGAVYQVALALAVILGGAAVVAADLIAGPVFDAPDLVWVVRVFGLALPFYVLYKLGLRGIQGYGETLPNVAVKQVLEPVARLAFVTAFVLAGFGLIGVATGYALGFVAAGIAATIALSRTGALSFAPILSVDLGGRRREILAFSLPLALTGGLGIVARQSDVIVLGVLSTSDAVGVYEPAFLAAQFMLIVTPAINYLFQPIVSRYEKAGELDRIERLYTVTTRWVVVLAFPVFAVLVLTPGQTLGAVFGSAYSEGAPALVVLAVGFYLSRFTGFSGSLLAAMGRTRVIMWTSVVAEIVNVLLNVVLIAAFGIVGAAAATGVSRVLNNGIQAVYLYRSEGLHPFKPTFNRPMAVAATATAATWWLVRTEAVQLDLLGGVAVAAALSLLFVGAVLATRSLYAIEVELLDAIASRLGLPVDVARHLDRFTR